MFIFRKSNRPPRLSPYPEFLFIWGSGYLQSRIERAAGWFARSEFVNDDPILYSRSKVELTPQVELTLKILRME